MKKVRILLCACLVAGTTLSAKNRFELNDIIDGKFAQKSSPAFHSSIDGETYNAPNNEYNCILKYSYKTGAVTDTLFDASKAKECNFKNFSGFELSDDEKRILIYTDREMIYRRSFKANYYTFEIYRNLVKPLTEGKVQAAEFSPNGRMVAFVRDNNIFLKKLDYGTESQVTTDGEINKVINGIPDWVYEEEFPMNKAFEWSPDNNVIAYIRFDESDVKQYSLPTYRGAAPDLKENELYPTDFTYKYPVAGEVNAKVSVHTFDVDTKRTKKMDLEVNNEDYIPRIKFTPDASKLVVTTLNRHQNTLRLHGVNPQSGVGKVFLQDENKAYVNGDNMDLLTYYPNFFVFVSEKSGYRHLYQYSLTGTLMKQLTSGDWDVTDFYGYDDKTKSFYFQAAKNSPLSREVYKVDSKGVITPVLDDKGTNSANFSKGFKYVQHYNSSAEQPMKVSVKDNKGKTLRIVESNEKLINNLSSYEQLKKEFVVFNNGKGDQLNAYIVKPSDFDQTKKYPVVMVQYGGPGSQMVLDKWVFDWTAYLADQGYVVACVDGRGTGARGADFERSTYLSLGLKESEDQIAGARYLSTLPFVDKNRIAIWGWSFGGYNTLMSMTGSDLFKVGIAVAPVTDFKFYDTIYTERYMRTPKENYDGYEKTSVLNRADKLKGKLLIITGSADDNVHPQNTYELTEQFVQNGIDFDMHVYTNRNHFINGGNTSKHLYKKMTDYLKSNL